MSQSAAPRLWAANAAGLPGGEDTSGAEGRGVAPHVVRRVRDDGGEWDFRSPTPCDKEGGGEVGSENSC